MRYWRAAQARGRERTARYEARSAAWTPAGRLPEACRTLAGSLPDAMDPGFHGVRTPGIGGFMAFRRARRTRITRLMLSVWQKFGFRGRRGAEGPARGRRGG